MRKPSLGVLAATACLLRAKCVGDRVGKPPEDPELALGNVPRVRPVGSPARKRVWEPLFLCFVCHCFAPCDWDRSESESDDACMDEVKRLDSRLKMLPK